MKAIKCLFTYAFEVYGAHLFCGFSFQNLFFSECAGSIPLIGSDGGACGHFAWMQGSGGHRCCCLALVVGNSFN